MSQFDQRGQHVTRDQHIAARDQHIAARDQYIAGGDINIYQPPLSLTEKQRKQNRTRMLDRVQAIWIDGVLEPSVQGAAQIALELQYKPSAIVTPLWHVLREFDTTGRLSSADSSIVQVYDHANGEVLILGEPGAGKTTLLLELTRALLERARQDETHPIPVIFILSSWAQTQQPLAEWLASELTARYQVPHALATSWIETDQVLPLLDGLDEVVAIHRAACVQAINSYRQTHGLLPTVVCSRLADYLAITTRLLLRTAVVVQPLTEQQIEIYLISAGEQMAGLRRALQEDAELHTLASTPLMLNVLTVAYQGTLLQEMATTSPPGLKRERVFAAYVQRMLTHRHIQGHQTPAQTVHWLTCLARQMKRTGQTIFYIEHMQPDWLAKGQPCAIYEQLAGSFIDVVIGFLFGVLVSTLFFGGSSPPPSTPSIFFNLAYGLLGGLIGGFISKGERRSAEKGGWSWRNIIPTLTDIRHLKTGFLLGMIVCLIGVVLTWLGIADLPGYPMPQLLAWLHDGLVVGLVGLLLSVLFWGGKAVNLLEEEANWSWRNIGRSLLKTRHVKIGLMAFLSVGLVFGLRGGIGGIYRELYDPVLSGLTNGVAYGVRAGLIAILLSFLLRGKRTVIQPAEIIIWSWKGLARSLVRLEHMRNSLIVGSSIVLSAGLGYGLYLLPSNFGTSEWQLNYVLGLGLESGLALGLTVGLSYWLFIGLLSGLSSNILEEHARVKPNQGIWHSARNSIVVGLLGGGICGSVLVLNYVFINNVLGQALGDWAIGGYHPLDLSAFWRVLLSFAKSTVQCS